ncbi:hypothetical protein NDU88_004863 [Pleurodeles waltl]|uniref:Uncharacterized protein n=1 Tax=Pleurodeles waltl TaxID=8319 RepID=A0AAV7SK56_PLEWA|nr:hypothetical protein NDU88_004863 [Pleurodeles waltl]
METICACGAVPPDEVTASVRKASGAGLKETPREGCSPRPSERPAGAGLRRRPGTGLRRDPGLAVGELEKSPTTAVGARPKEWSLQVRRGRRRLRTGRSTPWRIPRHTDMRVDTTDSEGSRSVRARTRRGQEGKSPRMSENGGGRGGGSPHPLLEAIDRMEVEQEARTQQSPDG